MAFDPAAETAKYIDSLGPEALAKAASYTVGSHWLLLWGLVVSAIVTWLIVRWGILDKVAGKLANRGQFLRTWAICAAFFLISSLISLPWDLYTGWGREKSYGRTGQPISDYLMQGGISIIIAALLGGLFFTGVYALIRRTGKRWWLWSGGLAAFAGTAMMLLAPILIEPIFNQYKPVPAGPVKDALVDMAAKANIPPDRIFMFDGSRQSNNFTANAGGILGSARIAISDVAMKQANLDEVKAVTGHEIGHYVLGHVWLGIAGLVMLVMLGFFMADRLFPRMAGWLGSEATIADPQGLPILLLIVSVLSMLSMPIMNSISRHDEAEADNYSLKNVNLPDALSTALVKTAEYRYPRPSTLQEVIFYNHPSVEWRVRNAMNWKAGHMPVEAGSFSAKP